ncbi:aromatic acid exporter family protein [Isoptericola variabilis]|uniref:Integral membrane bound transporter domain-containing protein n=1 Tax=Isoptericola variabilis (strain 225) TaxID=743718 RepID=F6FU16_ISOV2|nr:FUSC family protein [Isoptericola variabilis]AEG45387.1 hypothetical protein Isova_2685 [Isoptericola variabilis 225]TWH30269.1 uncharacterized membrane protein YgaE (UPF0421/DUF939 family) [Isoptericola variabilis J7]
MTAGPALGPAGEAARTALRSLGRRIRVRQGWARVRTGFWPVVQASLAAGAAYGFAHHVLGHAQPFFAAVAAWVCLGFSFDRELRRVAEVAVGVAVGVAMGDLVVHLIGSGWWQLTLVLLVSALVARFLDRGALLTTQAGVQAIVVVGLPAASVATGGALGRWTDALAGGGVALAVALLTPGDPRRRLRALAGEATGELADTLEALARGVRERDADELAAALVRGRASEPVLADWQDTARHAAELARVSVNRVHRTEIRRLAAQAVLVDRAMRSVRVLARRAPLVVRTGAAELDALADLLDRYASGVRTLAAALATGTGTDGARAELAAVAADADPRAVAEGQWQVQSLVLLLRSPVVDTLEAAGASAAQARDALPEI